MLRFAASVANVCSVPLVVLHALKSDVPPYFTPADVGQLESEIEQNRSVARQELIRMVKRAGCGEATKIHVEDGDPVSVIGSLSERPGPALIVMGTHRRSGLARIKDGSIAEEVLHSSGIPVLTLVPGDLIARARESSKQL